jgi:hypothetical protein
VDVTSRHRQIWDEIVSRMASIKTANGYATNVKTATKSPGIVAWTEIPPAARPWIGVISQSRYPTAEPRRWRERAQFDIVCILTARTEAEKFSAIDALDEDIRTAIGTDTRWGTNTDDGGPNAVTTNIVEIKTDDILEPLQGALVVTIEVIYFREMFAA